MAVARRKMQIQLSVIDFPKGGLLHLALNPAGVGGNGIRITALTLSPVE